MKSIIRIVFIISNLLASLMSYSQDCSDYHQYHCLYADYTFFYSKQSKSTLFKPGQSSEIRIVAYSGEDYYIAVCAHRKFGNIHYRILEDNAHKNVIYDNAADNYSESIIFSNDRTRNLIIEVSVPLESESNTTDRRCVGVVIEFRKTGQQ
jgi:hypothetical protein